MEMFTMLPISCTKDGITLTILSISKNKIYTCRKDCWNTDNCTIKKKCSLHPRKSQLVATEVVVALTNATNDLYKIITSPWELVDTEGYSCGGCGLCEDLIPARTVTPNSWSVSPGTRSKFVLVFPEMDSSADVLSLIYAPIMRFDIRPIPTELTALFEVKAQKAEEETLQQILEKDYQLKYSYERVQRLKELVFSRFHNVLTPKEQTSLDNQIINLEFSIQEYMQTATEKQKDILSGDFKKAMDTYHQEIATFKEQENRKKMMDQKVEQLYQLTPREFEEWTESLFKSLGFQNVVLTPQSGDKGLDLIAEKDGNKIAVQCKKFKGVVGSPVIQAFAGALQTAEIDKGYFITTGSYSVDAEKMAQDLPIELYDKNTLGDLIELAMKSENK